MARQVGGDDVAILGGEPFDDRSPVSPRTAGAVQEEEGLTLARRRSNAFRFDCRPSLLNIGSIRYPEWPPARKPELASPSIHGASSSCALASSC